MSLNIEYLQQLSAFTKFANVRINAEDKNAVACITQDGGNVQEISKNSLDKPYAFFPLVRSRTNKQMNNETRALFKNTIANLFGGEDKIPQSVKDDMHFGTFDGKGHPLTAKRINIVKNSILKVIRDNSDAGISEGEAMRILNAHGANQIIDEPINRDSLTNTKFSINDDGDNGNNIINTNTIKEAPKPQNNFRAELDQLREKANKLGGTENLPVKDRMRLIQLEGMVNGRGIMENFGVTSRVLSKNSTKIERDVNDTGDIVNVLNKQNVVKNNNKMKPKKVNFQYDD